MSFPFDQKFVWQPDPAMIKDTNLANFMQTNDIASYDLLLKRSIDDISWFWDAVFRDLDIQFKKPYDKVVDLSDGVQFPRWCINARMNIIYNCIDKWLQSDIADKNALIWEGEGGETKLYTYREIANQVNRCVNALKSLGVKKGDVVGLYMPMIPELVFAFLATIKMGAIILPIFSGYGPGAIFSRMNDSGVKYLITVDGTMRRGKKIIMKNIADQAVNELPGFKNMVVVNRANINNISWVSGRDHWWHDIIDSQSEEADTEDTSAEDPLMLIYTSGTTGKPKGAVHTHCGFPVKAAQDMYQCMDLKKDETIYWMTDMGWMMGPWEVFGTLLIGATMVFYDGAPDFPDHTRLWRQIDKHRITHLGVSPTLIRTLKQFGKKQLTGFDLSSLRMVGSTGSPWDPESWMWLFENVLDASKPIINYSGGTEISGGIVCGNFFKPLKPCAFSGPVPGMDADVVNENGQPVREQVGELIIRKPWIGMTRGFWQDKQRYIDTYWSRFDNLWVHGDFAAIDKDGLWYILGRSDDTIKVSGKRIGPAEVESILNSHPRVTESAVIGVPHDIKGEELVCFCVLSKDTQPEEDIEDELNNLVTGQLGKPLKPKAIKFTTKLPKTRNAKVMRRIIRATYQGSDPGDISSLEDPGAVEAIKNALL